MYNRNKMLFLICGGNYMSIRLKRGTVILEPHREYGKSSFIEEVLNCAEEWRKHGIFRMKYDDYIM